jgi:sugar/nucleoside kinase (ribokinase family)
MSILVVGSVAFDNIATPSGRVEDVLGGAATHFALAASFFTKVRVVAVVGDDFGAE